MLSSVIHAVNDVLVADSPKVSDEDPILHE
jgi:hypothetical protein